MKEKKAHLTWREKISLSQKKRWEKLNDFKNYNSSKNFLFQRYAKFKEVKDLKYIVFHLELLFQAEKMQKGIKRGNQNG